MISFPSSSHAHSFSPDDTTTSDKGVSTHALQFQILGGGYISDFQGALGSYKYHFNERNAVRVGIGLSSTDRIREGEGRSFGQDTSMQNDRNVFVDFEIALQTQFIHYFPVHDEVHLYTGLGARVAHERYESRRRLERTTTRYEEQRFIAQQWDEYNAMEYGLTGVYGVEWFFHDHMGLTAEYGFLLNYVDGEDTFREVRERIPSDNGPSINRGTTKTTQWRFEPFRVKLGLTVYL